MSKYDANDMKLGGLLAAPDGTPLTVPNFQRSYSWDLDNVSEFWNDITDFAQRTQHVSGSKNAPTYFLGSIVLVQRAGALEILDGQQRLATATILLASIKEYLKKVQAHSLVAGVEKYIVESDGLRDERTYRLKLNEYDADFFRHHIQDAGGAEFKTTHPSHRLILNAKEFLDTQVTAYCERGGGKEAARQLALLVADRLSTVVIVSDDENTAFDIFYSLNDRGENLAMPDKVRALLLRRSKDVDREVIVDGWEDILRTRKGAKVEDLIRYFWITKAGDAKARALHKLIEDDFRAREKTGERPTPKEFTEELRMAAVRYADLVAAKDDDAAFQSQLEAISAIGSKALYPALLALPDPPESGKERNEFIARRLRLTTALVRLYVRHVTICRLSGSDLEKWVYDFARRIAANSDASTIDTILGEIREHAPDDEVFQRAFEKAEAVGRVAHYLLDCLEMSMRGPSSVMQVGKQKAHVEHIYPQSPPEGVRWDDHEDWIDRIGNLTLLNKRKNQEAQNKPYAQKRTSYYTGSDLKMLERLPAVDEWSSETIAARQKDLAALAPSVWQMP